MTETRINLYNGYTYIRNEGGGQRALRYGEEWRDLTGDRFILAMAQEIEEQKKRADHYERALALLRMQLSEIVSKSLSEAIQ